MIHKISFQGHSPAGGCVLAISCDYRIMIDGKFKIGMNETQLGMPVPFWLVELMIKTIGSRAGKCSKNIFI